MSLTKENPIRQERVASYRAHIKALLRGEALGVPIERLDWDGYLEVLGVWRREVDKQPIIEAMRDIILKEEDWSVVGDTIDIANTLRITELKEDVRKFAAERFAQVDREHQEAISNVIDRFLTVIGTNQ